MKKKVGIIKRALCIGLVFLLNINVMAAIVSDNDGSAFITKAEFDSLKNNFQSQIDSYNQSIDAKIDGAIASYLAGINIVSYVDLAIEPGIKDVWWMDDVNQLIQMNRSRISGDFQYTTGKILKMPLTGRFQTNVLPTADKVFNLNYEYYMTDNTDKQKVITKVVRHKADLEPIGTVPWQNPDYTCTNNYTWNYYPYDELDKWYIGVCDDIPQHVLRYADTYALQLSLPQYAKAYKQATWLASKMTATWDPPIFWDTTNKILKFSMRQGDTTIESNFQYFCSYFTFQHTAWTSRYILEWDTMDKATSNRVIKYVTQSSSPYYYALAYPQNSNLLKNVMLGQHSSKKINFIKVSVDVNGDPIKVNGFALGALISNPGNVNQVSRVKIKNAHMEGHEQLFNVGTDWDSIAATWNDKEIDVAFGGYYSEDFYNINNATLYDTYGIYQPIAGGLPICKTESKGKITLRLKTENGGWGGGWYAFDSIESWAIYSYDY